MGSEPRRRKVVPRFDPMEARTMLSGAILPASDPGSVGTPSTASSPMIVAVIGSGIDPNASDPIHYTGETRYLDLTDAFNAVDGTYGKAAVAEVDPGGQGTRAASAAARGIADAVAAGGSSNVAIVPIRIQAGSGLGVPPYAVVGAIYHAVDFGARVIDLGYTATQFSITSEQRVQLDQAMQYARGKGVTVVVPAGDGFGPSPAGPAALGVDIDRPGTYYGVYPVDEHTSNLVVVTAIDSTGKLTGVSNWGATHVDLGAPTMVGDGSTDSAAGYASGVASVVASTRRDWSGIQVANRIKQTARAIAGLVGRSTTGGLISPTGAVSGVASAVASRAPDDLDGDLRTDFGVFGALPGVGYNFAVVPSSQGFATTAATLINNGGYGVGGPGSIPVPGQFHGGGITEPALLAPEIAANGQPTGKSAFVILGANASGVYSVIKYVAGIGAPGDIPVVGDFFRTGRDDLALYGYHNGQFNFTVLTAASDFDPTKIQILNNNGYGFGGPGSVPVVGDFFGNGHADPAVYGPELNAMGQPDGFYHFAALDSGTRTASGVYTRSVFARGFGRSGDIPVVGDYDGDGKSDLALYGPHQGQYSFLVLSSASGFNPSRLLTLNNNGYGFGGPGYVPIAGDFFGAGQTSLAVFGPEYAANGQPDGNASFAALDLKSKDAQGHLTRGLLIPRFGGPTSVAISAPPVVKFYQTRFP